MDPAKGRNLGGDVELDKSGKGEETKEN